MRRKGTPFRFQALRAKDSVDSPKGETNRFPWQADCRRILPSARLLLCDSVSEKRVSESGAKLSPPVARPLAASASSAENHRPSGISMVDRVVAPQRSLHSVLLLGRREAQLVTGGP